MEEVQRDSRILYGELNYAIFHKEQFYHFLAIESEIAEIVETYIRHKLMPNERGGDAVHLAIASYYKCDILLTWNCSHLANANKFNHVRRVNTLQGLFVPVLTTPLELLGEDYESR